MVGVGTILKGRYKLLEVLGQGSYGVVYKSHVLQSGQLVAIKVLKSELTSEPKKVERFRREAQSVRGLPSEAIVKVLDSDEQEGNFFNVYELVEGSTLRQVLDRSRVLPIDQALGIIIQVLRGLDVAHQAGVIHRDLKPANIMITKTGQPKIMDFGIAKDINKTSLTTEAYDQALGTPNYISPEQAQGSMDLDYRSDIYSVGVMLFEMLAGRPPFVADSTLSLLLKHINENPPLLYSLNSSIPPQLDGIIRTAMAKKPDSRYQSAEQFANVLTHFMNNLNNSNNSPIATPLGGWANWGGGSGTPTRFVPPPIPKANDKSNLPPILPTNPVGSAQNQQILDMPTQPINFSNRPLPGTAPLPNSSDGRNVGGPPPENKQNTTPPVPPAIQPGIGSNQPANQPNQRPPGIPPLGYVPMGSGPNQQPYNPQGSGPNSPPQGQPPFRPQGGPPPIYGGTYNPSASGQFSSANQPPQSGPNFGAPPIAPPPIQQTERKKVPWILIGGIVAAIIIIAAIIGLFMVAANGNNNNNTSGQVSPAATITATTAVSTATTTTTVVATTTISAATPSPEASPSPSPSPTTAIVTATTNPNETVFQQATKLVDAKDWKNAIAALEGLQGKGYNEEQVQKLLTQSYCSYGQDLVGSGDPTETFLTLQKCVNLDATNAAAKEAFDTISQYRDGVIFADQKNWTAAIPILEKLFAAKPDFRDVQPRLYDGYLQVISEYRQNRRYADALATCNKAKSADKGTGPVAASTLCADIQREINALTPVATPTPRPTVAPTPTPRSCFSNFFAYNNSSPGAIPAGPDQGSSSVVGVVLNRQKAGIPGATVRVSTAGFSFTTQTGGDGRFSIGGLGKGRWDVVVIAAPGYKICSSFSAAANLSGQSGSTVQVDFVESEP